MLVAAPQTMSRVLADGTTIAAANVICGNAVGTANLSAMNTWRKRHLGSHVRHPQPDHHGDRRPGIDRADSIAGGDPVRRSATSTVTAKVTDAFGDNVADGTNVNFSVVALGTANPINVPTWSVKPRST